MSKACNLDNSVINLNVIREDSRNELLGLLEGVKDKNICLVLDKAIAGPLNHILVDGTSALKNHGVKDVFELSKKELNTSCTTIVFLVHPVIKYMRVIATHVKTISSSSKATKFRIFFVPKQTLVCEEVLRKEGIYGSVSISTYPLDLIPYDDDLLSLELDDTLRKCTLDQDKSDLMTVATSIIKLQNIYGLIPNVKYKGSMSKVIWQMMRRFRLEQDARGTNISTGDAEIDTIVILDRNVDFVTPMCTSLTYEGLIDEIIGINNGFVKLEQDILADEDEKEKEGYDPHKTISLPLNSNDKLYAEVRDYNVEQLAVFLAQKAKDIRERYDEFRQNKDATIGEIREFVKRIPGLKQNYQALQQHINIAELLKKTVDGKAFRALWTTERTMLEGDTVYDQLEEMISMQEPLFKILRLMCLQSLTNGGLKAKNFDQLRKDLIQIYGFELLIVLNLLEKGGLIKRRETLWADSSYFTSIRKSLRLINDSVNVRDPGDIAYVTSGYAPLSVRIVEAAMKPNGWNDISEALRQIPGPYEEVHQGKTSDSKQPDDAYSNGEKKTMLVYFLGGVTYMEIAALRFLSRHADSRYDIIVATTKVVNGNTMICSLFDKEIVKSLESRKIIR